MRSFVIACFLLIAAYPAISQLRLTPQIGLEMSKTTITLNDLNSFSPLGTQFSPQATMRLDYMFKKGHGPFMGIGTSRSVVAFDFTNPEAALTNYKAVRENLQLRIEGGYQFSTKPFYFKASSPQKKTSSQRGCCSGKMKQQQSNAYKTNCGDSKCKSEQRSACGQKPNNARQMFMKKNSIPYVRLQPLAGLAFIPSPKENMNTKTFGSQTTYSYNAGNWNTAFVTGLGLEFGKGNTKKFQVNIQYLKGIGNLGTTELTTVSGNKTTHSTFSSKTGSWNITTGIPISLSKNSSVKQKMTPHKENYKQNCERMKKSYEQIKTRCRTVI